MAHSREMAPSISSRRPVAKSEPNRHPEILTLLLFEKYLLNSYYVKDTARLEDTLKAHVPVLKMFGDNCKNHFNSVQKSAKLEICTYYGLPRHHKFRRFGGQADSMLRISHSGSWRNQNMPVCWVHSVLFFFFFSWKYGGRKTKYIYDFWTTSLLPWVPLFTFYKSLSYFKA